MLALLAIAFADVLFAVDSVPAILAITTDTFVVFAANAFALMGLRALFFLVAGLVERVRLPADRPRRPAHRDRGQARLRRADRGEDPHQRDARSRSPCVLTVSVLASLLKERRGTTPQPQEG